VSHINKQQTRFADRNELGLLQTILGSNLFLLIFHSYHAWSTNLCNYKEHQFLDYSVCLKLTLTDNIHLLVQLQCCVITTRPR